MLLGLLALVAFPTDPPSFLVGEAVRDIIGHGEHVPALLIVPVGSRKFEPVSQEALGCRGTVEGDPVSLAVLCEGLRIPLGIFLEGDFDSEVFGSGRTNILTISKRFVLRPVTRIEAVCPTLPRRLCQGCLHHFVKSWNDQTHKQVHFMGEKRSTQSRSFSSSFFSSCFRSSTGW